MTSTLHVKPQANGFGAEVTGLDLSRPLPAPVLAATGVEPERAVLLAEACRSASGCQWRGRAGSVQAAVRALGMR